MLADLVGGLLRRTGEGLLQGRPFTPADQALVDEDLLDPVLPVRITTPTPCTRFLRHGNVWPLHHAPSACHGNVGPCHENVCRHQMLSDVTH